MAKTFVNPTTTIEAKLAEYKELKEQEKEIQKMIFELNNDLKTIMTALGTDAMECGEYTAELVECVRTGVDKDTLKKEIPEIYEKYKTETPYTRLLVK